MLPLLARAAALTSKAANFGSKVGGFSSLVQSWDGMFDGWIPRITISHSVTAQGHVNASPRTTLHLALATAFGMSVSKNGDKFSIVAKVDQRSNVAEVEFTLNCSTTASITDGVLSLLPSIRAPNAPGGAGGAGIKDAGITPEQFTRESVDAAVAGVQGKEIPAGPSPTNPIVDLENPPLIVKPRIVGNLALRGLGGLGVQDQPVRAPWLIAKVVLPEPGAREIFQQLAQAQDFSLRDGPKLLFEIAKDSIFSGQPPWPVARNGDVQPFTDIVKFHAPPAAGRQAVGNTKPILTREPAINPQYEQALGVDLKTLVAQVLHDPGVLPPSPKTNEGQPTVVGV